MLGYYVHDLDPLIFRLWDNVGPRWYGLAYVLAFICGYFIYRRLAQRGYADLSAAKVGDVITGAALFGVIVGGRLGYILFYKPEMDRKSTRLNSSHLVISYAVFCLKKKKQKRYSNLV